MLVVLIISVWRFNTAYQIKKIYIKEWTKAIEKKPQLYKCIKARTSAIWQQILLIPPTRCKVPNVRRER